MVARPSLEVETVHAGPSVPDSNPSWKTVAAAARRGKKVNVHSWKNTMKQIFINVPEPLDRLARNSMLLTQRFPPTSENQPGERTRAASSQMAEDKQPAAQARGLNLPLCR